MLSSFSSTLLVQIPLSFDFFLAYAVRFVPMKLGLPDSTIAQLHPRHALEFPPPAAAIGPAQSRNFPDAATDRYGLDLGDLPDYLEVHVSRTSVSWLVPHPIQAVADPGRVATT